MTDPLYDISVLTGQQYTRWLEYSVSSSLMKVVIALLLRLHNGVDLTEIFTTSAATQTTGAFVQATQLNPLLKPLQLGLFGTGMLYEASSWAKLYERFNSFDSFLVQMKVEM